MRTAQKQRNIVRRSRDDERKLDKLIDELCGCLTEGNALAELEREHRAEVVADAQRRS